MKHLKPLTALVTVTIFFILLITVSCTEQRTRLLLRVNYAPEGKVLKYSLDLHRVGKSYKNGEFVRDFERKMEAEISYTTEKLYFDGTAAVLEKNLWTWDEVVDTNKVKRQKAEYSFDLKIATSGKVTDFNMLSDVSPSYKEYAANYYEQAIMVFPDSAVSIGYTWTQTTPVVLTEGDTADVTTTYKIKGIARKMEYDCAVIEFRGELILPYQKDPKDSLGVWGTDRIENNGILYFAYKEGFPVSSEERSRVKHERHLTEKGEEFVKLSEFEEAGSCRLVEISGI
jgi:hypothetical protein